MAYNWGDQGWEEGFTVVQYGARLQFTSGDTYNWSPSGDPYDNAYASLRDVENIIRDTEDERRCPELLRRCLGDEILDLFLCYRCLRRCALLRSYHVVLRDGNVTPAFDAQSCYICRYFGRFRNCEYGFDGMLDNISGDIIYNGDIEKWRKFANSLRLRLLMRISDVDNATAVAGMAQITGNPSAYPIFESNEDMAFVEWNSDNPQPKYDARSGSFDEVRLSQTLETRLKDLNDNRLYVFAQPTTDSDKGIFSEDFNDYVGMPNGLDDEAALGYSPSGNPDESGSNFISRLGILLACRACNPEQASATASHTIIMSYSELQFILAEAAERGFISLAMQLCIMKTELELHLHIIQKELPLADGQILPMLCKQRILRLMLVKML